jgi:hypothetical protein
VRDAAGFKWLTKTMVSEGSPEDFIKKAGLYIVFQLIKLKNSSSPVSK